MQRYKLRIAYNGKTFSGWQIQKNTTIKTVQGELERVLSFVLSENIYVQGASRTDAGVHAQGQVAHITTIKKIDIYSTIVRTNRLLAPNIIICEIEPVPLSFHAQRYTKRKHYIYSLWNNKTYILPQYYDYVWAVYDMDIALMELSSQYFIGTHDFKVFQNIGTSLLSTIRTIYSIEFIQGKEKELLEIHICGNGFLKQMVRNIIGLLVFIGRKKIPISFLNESFFLYERKNIPSPTAPAQGLSLYSIEYENSIS